MIEQITTTLKTKSLSITELAKKYKITEASVKRILKDIKLSGYMLEKIKDKYTILTTQKISESEHTYESEKDNTYRFGFIGDTHLCSKYERLDVLNDLYDIYELEDITRVFHAGNWVEGEAPFNLYELKKHGIDDQIDYLVKNYPQKESITTYAISGDDHEGWWAKRQGIDIGRHAQHAMREAGRTDWIDLGYMESYVQLKNANTKKTTRLLVMHPGGGSAYAVSYRPQKIVESLSGGEKPDVLLIGHYHKLSYNFIRNVHTIQCGCTQDQTTFMRKKGIDAHVGGGICELKQDPSTGNIYSCKVEFFNYTNRATCNKRWSYRGDVSLPKRGVSNGR